MSLRKKTIYFSVLIFIIATAVTSLLSIFILRQNFLKIERDRAILNTDRAHQAFLSQIENINTKIADWAIWDDNYQFVQDANQNFIDSNLQPVTLGNLKLNAMVFLNNSRQVVTSVGYDLKSKLRVPVSPSLLTLLTTSDNLMEFSSLKSSKSGVLMIDGKPFLFALRPVIHSDETGPIMGALLFGRYLDADILATLENLTKVSIASFAIDDRSIVSDVAKVEKKISAQSPYEIIVHNNNLTYGYIRIQDYFARPALWLQIENERIIYQQGIATIAILISFLILTAATYTTVSYIFLDRLILRRLITINAALTQIRRQPQSAACIVSHGPPDELTSLVDSINKTLSDVSLNQSELRTERDKADDVKKAVMNLLEDAQQLEGALKDERDRARAIVEAMGEGLLVIDKDENVSYINPAGERLLGISGVEATGKKWTSFTRAFKGSVEILPQERSFTKTLRSGTVIYTTMDDDHYYQGKNGRLFPVLSVTSPLKNNGIVGAIKVFRDITGEKESKRVIEEQVTLRTRELKEEHARLEASINHLPIGFLLLDNKHQILMANPTLSQILGFSQKLTYQLLEKEFQKAHFDFYQVCSHCTGKHSIARFDDLIYKGKFLKIASISITTESGTMENVVLIEDVTETKHLELAKDEFFSIASHELRTPLTAIRGNASLIEQFFLGKINDADFTDMVHDIHEASVRLITIVNDFLSLSRLEQKHMEFKREKFDIKKTITEVFTEMKSLADEKKLYLRLSTRSKIEAAALADSVKVKEVLVNLIGNAIKFTSQGGITVTIGENGGFWEVRVSDTGVGISETNQQLLFQKFQQASDSVLTRDATRGTGLGLYISKMIIEGMYGTIKLEYSQPDTGSTFLFTLPKAFGVPVKT